MELKAQLAVLAVALLAAVPASAATANLDSEFGSLSGTIYGLDSSDGTSSATSFSRTGLAGAYSSVPLPYTRNNFTFSEGNLVGVDLFDSAPRIADGGVLPSFFSLSLFADIDGFYGNSVEIDGVTPAVGFRTASFSLQPVLLPVTALMLAAVAGCFFVARRRLFAR